MKYITFKQNYLNNILITISDYKQAIENHRLISKIDDNGNINGSILLFNHKQSNDSIQRVTGDINIIKEHYPSGEADKLLNSFLYFIEGYG